MLSLNQFPHCFLVQVRQLSPGSVHERLQHPSGWPGVTEIKDAELSRSGTRLMLHFRTNLSLHLKSKQVSWCQIRLIPTQCSLLFQLRITHKAPRQVMGNGSLGVTSVFCPKNREFESRSAPFLFHIFFAKSSWIRITFVFRVSIKCGFTGFNVD